MKTSFPAILIGLAASSSLMAGTVVVTSLPDESRPVDPLSSFDGTPLAGAAEIRVGAFPGMSDDDLLDAAASGGLAAVTAAMVPFGGAHEMGAGTAGAPGSFEISASASVPDDGSPLAGEDICLLVRQGGEFLVARFPGQTFSVDPDTGLEQVAALHIADARLAIGTRYGAAKLSTALPSSSGSYASWIATFAAITNPELRDRDADADGDGRSNFFEYVTGSDPTTGVEPSPCQIVRGADESLWVKFRREAGIGEAGGVIENSPGLNAPWTTLEGEIEPDPEPPVPGATDWMRMRVDPEGAQGFFRLQVETGSER